MASVKAEKILFIRCSGKTRTRFRRFVADFDFSDYEKALEELLKLAETHPELVKVRWG